MDFSEIIKRMQSKAIYSDLSQRKSAMNLNGNCSINSLNCSFSNCKVNFFTYEQRESMRDGRYYCSSNITNSNSAGLLACYVKSS